ncbi:MAG: hypothetical protein IKO26_00875 [Paludibacteraceae bacterium]|nr:hypothetical protein [Paludibacteraceae bacterium]
MLNATLLLCSISVFSEHPNWYNDSQRLINYPREQYYIGIAYDEVHTNESAGTSIERAKIAARVEALSTISVHVQNETNAHLHDESYESINTWREEIKETFDSRSRMNVELKDIPGLQVDAWKNPENNEVVAFAYIKKSTLCRQMDKQITAEITRIETSLENAEALIANGQKLLAHEAINKVPPSFQKIEQAQLILIATDPLSDAESLQIDETRQLSKRYISLYTELKNSINLYLVCTTDILGDNYFPIEDQIKKELSKAGCTFVEDSANADWTVKIHVHVTLDDRKSNSEEDFVTIDVSGIVINITKQSGHELYESDRESAFKVNGGYKLAVDKILRRGDLISAITNDIINILKS